MPARRRLAGLALIGLVAVGVTSLAAPDVLAEAGDWNPFRERDEKARRERKPTDAQPPLAPPLPAMDGRLPQPGIPGAPYPGTAQPRDLGLPPGGAQAASGSPGFPTAGVPPAGQRGNAVERVELAPLPATDSGPAGAGEPPESRRAGPASASPPGPSDGPPGRFADLWRGMDMPAVEAHIAPLEIPPRSPAMHALWSRLLSASATPPAGGLGASHFLALRLEALYRSGLVAEMGALIDSAGLDPADPLIAAFRIRRHLVDGDAKAACVEATALAGRPGNMPKLLKGEVIVLGGYCAAVEGNFAAAGLAAGLARDEEVAAPLALAVLDALASGGAANGAGSVPRLALPKRLLVLDYRLLELLGPVDPGQVLDKAEPALLVALAGAASNDAKTRIAAAELAAGLNAIAPAKLADVYRSVSIAGAAAGDAALKRAQLFRAMELEQTPVRRVQLLRTLLEEGRRGGLTLPLARAAVKAIDDVAEARDLGPLAETAIAVAIVSGQPARARQLAEASPELAHWLVLAEIADPALKGVREPSLAQVEELARRGRFTPDMLHRLATVLDALDVHVPIPLWEAASRTPQPNVGHLPETGVLPRLLEAAKRREVARAILLVLATLGPAGGEGAHLIALGDSIRALRRAGLDADARQLSLEALFAGWPRAAAVR